MKDMLYLLFLYCLKQVTWSCLLSGGRRKYSLPVCPKIKGSNFPTLTEVVCLCVYLEKQNTKEGETERDPMYVINIQKHRCYISHSPKPCQRGTIWSAKGLFAYSCLLVYVYISPAIMGNSQYWGTCFSLFPSA